MYWKVSERTKVAMSDFLGRRWTTERGSWTNSATPRTSTLISRPCRDLHLTNASVCVSQTHIETRWMSHSLTRFACLEERQDQPHEGDESACWFHRLAPSGGVLEILLLFTHSENLFKHQQIIYFVSTSWFSQHSPRCAIELSSAVFRKLAHYARSVSWHISQALDTKHRYFLSSQLTLDVVSMSRNRRKKIVDLFRDWKLAKSVASLRAINSLASSAARTTISR